MADPSGVIPHLLGITLDTNGVALTQVVAVNRTTGERLIKATNSDKVVIFDAADFDSGYSADDVIDFHNVGSSVGSANITINSAEGGFQDVELDAAAAPTTSVGL